MNQFHISAKEVEKEDILTIYRQEQPTGVQFYQIQKQRVRERDIKQTHQLLEVEKKIKKEEKVVVACMEILVLINIYVWTGITDLQLQKII